MANPARAVQKIRGLPFTLDYSKQLVEISVEVALRAEDYGGKVRWICGHPICTKRGFPITFGTIYDKQHHDMDKHGQSEALRCPQPGCDFWRAGTRLDQVQAHVRDDHDGRQSLLDQLARPCQHNDISMTVLRAQQCQSPGVFEGNPTVYGGNQERKILQAIQILVRSGPSLTESTDIVYKRETPSRRGGVTVRSGVTATALSHSSHIGLRPASSLSGPNSTAVTIFSPATASSPIYLTSIGVPTWKTTRQLLRKLHRCP